jgi:ubiquinone/menaquinone biosynthesis C-methylase UbiE
LTLFLSKTSQAEKERYLDLGCGDGELTREVASLFNAKEVYCVDRDETSLIKAKERGIKIVLADLEINQLPFPGDYFDVVTAFDVIEHLKNPDNMLSEAYRVLKNKGLFILSTPNLASWVNRLLLLFGYIPFEYECPGRYGEDLEKRPFQRVPSSFGHVRLYTFKTSSKLLEQYDFTLIYSTSYAMGYVQKNLGLSMVEKLISKLRKTLGSGIILMAMKGMRTS